MLKIVCLSGPATFSLTWVNLFLGVRDAPKFGSLNAHIRYWEVQISIFAQNIPDFADLAPINADGSEILHANTVDDAEQENNDETYESEQKTENKEKKQKSENARRAHIAPHLSL